jgi:hypothetical protein
MQELNDVKETISEHFETELGRNIVMIGLIAGTIASVCFGYVILWCLA